MYFSKGKQEEAISHFLLNPEPQFRNSAQYINFSWLAKTK